MSNVQFHFIYFMGLFPFFSITLKPIFTGPFKADIVPCFFALTPLVFIDFLDNFRNTKQVFIEAFLTTCSFLRPHFEALEKHVVSSDRTFAEAQMFSLFRRPPSSVGKAPWHNLSISPGPNNENNLFGTKEDTTGLLYRNGNSGLHFFDQISHEKPRSID